MNIRFGEIFGKHSEIECTIQQNEIIEFSDNQEFVKLIENANPSIGNNPFNANISYEYDGVYYEDITVRELIGIINK